MKHKTRAIGKWHGLQSGIQQPLSSSAPTLSQPSSMQAYRIDGRSMVLPIWRRHRG